MKNKLLLTLMPIFLLGAQCQKTPKTIPLSMQQKEDCNLPSLYAFEGDNGDLVACQGNPYSAICCFYEDVNYQGQTCSMSICRQGCQTDWVPVDARCE